MATQGPSTLNEFPPEGEHPAPEVLRAFLEGKLDEAGSIAVEDHLCTCVPCGALLEKSATVADPLQALFRLAARDSGAGDAAPPPDAAASSSVSGYDLLEVIGRGGMGVVYKARQRSLGRVVAFKQVRAYLDGDPQELARFRIEAEAIAKLKHPGIVQVFDVGWRDGAPFLAMEFIDGGTLDDRLRPGPLPPKVAAQLVETIARAIEHAHAEGVIHRDLKPGNILMTRAGEPKVADFGLAKRLDIEATPGPTRTGALIGTPSYMSPEQADGRPADRAVDVYALGAILYECITGRPPFQAATPLETLEQVRREEPPRPSRLQPKIPRELQTICLKCLEKDPRRRYASAGELAEDLGRFLRGESILARPVGAVGRAWKWSKREPWKAALVAFGLIAVAGGFVGLIAHQRRLRVEIDRANEAAKLADSQRKLADANYREARSTIQSMLARFGDARRPRDPRIEPYRIKMTEDAVKFFDGVLAAAESPDPLVRFDTALAAREAGNLQASIGRVDDTIKSMTRSLKILEELSDAKPDDTALLRERMVALLKLGVVTQYTGHGKGLASKEKALALAQRLYDMDPRPTLNRSDLAWCLDNLGGELLVVARYPGAEAALKRAVELRRTVVADIPKDPGGIIELAGSLINLGLIWGDRPDEADAAFREASGLLRKLLDADPTDVSATIIYANLLNNWSINPKIDISAEVRRERLDDGIRRIEAVVKDYPLDAAARAGAKNLHGSRGNLLTSQGKYAEAIRDWDRGNELAETKEAGLVFRMNSVLCRLKAGDYRTWRAILREDIDGIARKVPPPGDDFYNVACLASLSLKAVREDKGLNASERERLSKQERDEAFRWLRMSREAGYLKDKAAREHARTDSDLEAIRADGEFAEILRED